VSTTPFISVIVPVYNVEKYLPRCLDSILGQSFRDIEVICVYDDSHDQSWNILQSYADRDDRVHILNKNTGCLSSARNLGIHEARGTFLSFIDADDELLPDAFTRIAPCFDTETDIVCFGVEEVVESNGKSFVRESGYFDLPFEGSAQINDQLRFQICWTVWNKMFRTDFVKNAGLTFPEHCQFEDNPFTLNAFAICGKIFLLNEKLYRYFRHASSLSANANQGHAQSAFDYLRILEHMYEFWSKHQLFSDKLSLFQKICVRMFRSAVQVCLPYEKAGIVWEMTKLLQGWELSLDEPYLKQIRDGDYSIRLGQGWNSTDIEQMKKLKGFQRIFYLGNSRNHKVLCLFGVCVLRWKKRSIRTL